MAFHLIGWLIIGYLTMKGISFVLWLWGVYKDRFAGFSPPVKWHKKVNHDRQLTKAAKQHQTYIGYEVVRKRPIFLDSI